MTGEPLPVAIVGGGIAGLALALNLHARGIATRVFEGAPELRELGVGITLLPHAVRELSALRLAEETAALGIENATSAFYNRFGQRIFAEPRGRAAGYPFPEYGVHRGRLHMMLYRAVLERLGADAVATGHRRGVGRGGAARGDRRRRDRVRRRQLRPTRAFLSGRDGALHRDQHLARHHPHGPDP